MALDFYSLCTVASFFDIKDFKTVVSTCKAWSQCRHDVRTVAQVYVNTYGDDAPFEAAEDGCPVVRFFARLQPNKILDMARESIINGDEDAPVLLVPFVSDEMARDLAQDVMVLGPAQLATYLKYWHLDDDTRRNLYEYLESYYDLRFCMFIALRYVVSSRCTVSARHLSPDTHRDICRLLLLNEFTGDMRSLKSMMDWFIHWANRAAIDFLLSLIERNEAGALADWMESLSFGLKSPGITLDSPPLSEYLNRCPRPWTLDFKLAVMRINIRVQRFDLFDELYSATVEETAVAIELDPDRLWHFLRFYPADEKLYELPVIKTPDSNDDVDALLAKCGHPSGQHQKVDEKLAGKKAVKQILDRMCVEATDRGNTFVRDRLIELGYTERIDKELSRLFADCCAKRDIGGASFFLNRMHQLSLGTNPAAQHSATSSFYAVFKLPESPQSTQLLRNIVKWWSIDVKALRAGLFESLLDGKLEFAEIIYDANRTELRMVFDRFVQQYSVSSWCQDSFVYALGHVRSQKTVDYCLEMAALCGRIRSVEAVLAHMEPPPSEAAIHRVLEKVPDTKKSNACIKLLHDALKK